MGEEEQQACAMSHVGLQEQTDLTSSQFSTGEAFGAIKANAHLLP